MDFTSMADTMASVVWAAEGAIAEGLSKRPEDWSSLLGHKDRKVVKDKDEDEAVRSYQTTASLPFL